MASLVAHSNVLMSGGKGLNGGANVHHCSGKVTAAPNKDSPVAMLSRVINSAEAEQELMLQSCHQQVAQMQPLQCKNPRATFMGNSILFPVPVCRCHLSSLPHPPSLSFSSSLFPPSSPYCVRPPWTKFPKDFLFLLLLMQTIGKTLVSYWAWKSYPKKHTTPPN